MLPIHFAPLQGYTEDVYRRAHHHLCGGVARYYTPFMRVEHGEVRRKDVFDMLPQHNEGLPLALQFIASDVREFETLLATAEAHWAAPLHIDLNMGCPFPLQVRHGRGAGLMADVARVEQICAFMAAHTAHTYSVKMRLGVERADEWRDVMPVLAAAPLTHITLHPRVAAQQYGGTPDMEAFSDFLAASPHPVVYNGDIATADDIRRLEERYPQLAGVMVGRGMLARPTLAREYTQGADCSDADVIAALRSLHDAVYENYSRRIPGEAQLLSKVRTFWDYAEPLLGRKAWKKIHKAGSMKNYLAAIESACREIC